jgi:DNA-binding ferritin-like protein
MATSANDMTVLATYLRSMQLYYHHVHHHLEGPSFFADHEHAAESYAAVEGHFDSVVERTIGTHGSATLDLNDMLSRVAKYLKGAPGVEAAPLDFWKHALKMEQALQKMTEALCKGADEADKQLISTIGDTSKSRAYQLKRRIGEG